MPDDIDQLVETAWQSAVKGSWSLTAINRDACQWALDPDPDFAVWETFCGEAFQLETGGPTENKMKFCCYCGKVLTD